MKSTHFLQMLKKRDPYTNVFPGGVEGKRPKGEMTIAKPNTALRHFHQ